MDVRAGTPADRDAVLRVAVSSGLFGPDDVVGFAEVVDATLGGPDVVWLVADADDGAVAGAAYCGPEPFGDRVWNLWFLAVDPASQARGVGTALVGTLVDRLAGRARVLLVETSSAPAQAGARAFYAARGFTHEATVREFYGPDEDKVVYWRRLPP